MLGIRGDEEEQPARRSAVEWNISIWNVGPVLRGEGLTEQYDGYGYEYHKNMVVSDDRSQPW